jgi:EPS-associated MarR family transcriptional regulator
MNTLSVPQQPAGFQEEIPFEVLRRRYKTPELSQRTLANELGISLGGINFCVQALVKKGYIKMHKFSNSNEKLRYVYFLTLGGLAEKSKLTSRFLKQKPTGYETLQSDIESLRMDLDSVDLEVVVTPHDSAV